MFKNKRNIYKDGDEFMELYANNPDDIKLMKVIQTNLLF